MERNHGPVDTDYCYIARISEEHARLLNKEGIGWLYGEPNWDEHYKILEIYKLEKQQKEINQKLGKLKG